MADNKTGYFGVHLKKPTKPGQHKPYQAQVTRGGKKVSLGCLTERSRDMLKIWCEAMAWHGHALAGQPAGRPELGQHAETRSVGRG